MSGSHLCPRCGGWHAITGPCHARLTPGIAFGMTHAAREAQSTPRSRTEAMVAAQSEADTAEAEAIALYRQRFRTGEAPA